MPETKDTHLTLTVDWPEITIDRLARVTQLWSSLVQSVSAEAARKRNAVRWVVTAVTFSSPLRLTTTPEASTENVNPFVVEGVSRAVLAGIENLQREVTHKPKFYSDESLRL